MRHFLILFNDIPLSKTSVKSGTNSHEVITAVRCVNVGLFVSGNLRRDVVISLAKGPSDDLSIISFPGADLKRVSPDERSISFFLWKATSIAKDLVMNSLRILDNGIEVRRNNLKNFLELVTPARVYLSTPDITADFVEDAEYDDSLLIYSNEAKLELIEEDIAWKVGNLPRFPHPERLILDVNMIVDLKKAS